MSGRSLNLISIHDYDPADPGWDRLAAALGRKLADPPAPTRPDDPDEDDRVLHAERWDGMS